MKPNTLLFTRDGTQIGNAIVVEVVGGLHTLLTDYGNVVREMTAKDLREFFIFGGPDAASAKALSHPRQPKPRMR